MTTRGQYTVPGAKFPPPAAEPPPPPPVASGRREPDAPQWAATVKPGDTLVIGFQHEFTDQQASHAYAQFAKLLPGVKVVIAAGVTSMAVAPAEPSGGAV